MNLSKKDTLFRKLHNNLKGSSLSLEKHPVVKRLNKMTGAELRTIIENYSCLSNRAIHYLVSALVYSTRWPNLYREIEHNIEEEKGLNTDGVPHLAMMREGYMRELGINTAKVIPLKCTRDFLAEMETHFLNEEQAFVAGAVLAFESAAIDEFHVLDSIVKQYSRKCNRELGRLTRDYIDGHKYFEIEHSNRLRNAISSHIIDEELPHLELGFSAVCLSMESWWTELDSRVNKMYHRKKEK